MGCEFELVPLMGLIHTPVMLLLNQSDICCLFFFSRSVCVCTRMSLCVCVCARVCLHRSIWFLKHALSQKLIHILTINTYNESLGAHVLTHTAPDLISCHASCAIILGVKYLFLSIHTFEKDGQC